MADDKQVDFVDGVTAVTEQFLDRIQEVEQPLAWNFNLVISGTSLVLQAGTLENRASLIIKGKMRYTESPLSISFTPLAAGSYGIWANTTTNDASAAFTLQAVLGTSAPSGVTYTRKIATVDWNGSNLSNLVFLSPYQKHISQHIQGGSDPFPNNSLPGAALIDLSVTTAKINDSAVTPAKMEVFPFLHHSSVDNSSTFSNSAVILKTANATQRGLTFLVNALPSGNYQVATIPRNGIYTITLAVNFNGPLNGTYVQPTINISPKDNYYNTSPAAGANASVSITDYLTTANNVSFFIYSNSSSNPGMNIDIMIAWVGP